MLVCKSRRFEKGESKENSDFNNFRYLLTVFLGISNFLQFPMERDHMQSYFQQSEHKAEREKGQRGGLKFSRHRSKLQTRCHHCSKHLLFYIFLTNEAAVLKNILDDLEIYRKMSGEGGLKPSLTGASTTSLTSGGMASASAAGASTTRGSGTHTRGFSRFSEAANTTSKTTEKLDNKLCYRGVAGLFFVHFWKKLKAKITQCFLKKIQGYEA